MPSSCAAATSFGPRPRCLTATPWASPTTAVNTRRPWTWARIADWKGFSARRAEAKKRGKLRGIGLANYIELTMGFPREWGQVTVKPGRRVEVAVGTLSSGQGHETSFTQCVSEWLGVPFERVNLVQGDTDRIPVGGGTHSGRSMRMAGFVMGKATDAVIARGKRIAAQLLEAVADIEFAAGNLRRCKVPIASKASSRWPGRRRATRICPADLRGPLAESTSSFSGRRLSLRRTGLRSRDRS